MRVLVVDDDESIRDFVGWALEDEGYEVVLAPNGADALLKVAEARPDVILLDMRMPVMDGWQFAREYRGMANGTAPIVVLTAARDAAFRASEIGADGHLAKPFRLDELLATIDHYVVSTR